MLRCKAVLVVFLLGVSYAWCSYNKPQIQAFTPVGFRVSIDDEPSIKRVEFHVNIKNNYHQKDFFKNVRHKLNGRWMFINRKVRLEIGDAVNCWLLVVKDRGAYTVHAEPFLIKELVNIPSDLQPLSQKKRREETETHTCKDVQSTEPPTPPPENNLRLRLSSCEKMVLNSTLDTMSLQNQVGELLKINQQLTSMIEKYPDARKLTLGGRIPPDDDPIVTVKFILWEKLDLEPKIVSAVKNSDNSITFELATMSEKLKILDVAKYKLRYSKILIF